MKLKFNGNTVSTVINNGQRYDIDSIKYIIYNGVIIRNAEIDDYGYYLHIRNNDTGVVYEYQK